MTSEAAPIGLVAAVGRTRREIEAAWGAPIEGGANVRYAEARSVRYRDGVAESVEGRSRERSRSAPSLDDWLGVEAGGMARCRRNLEAWCVLELGDLSIERRAGVYRVYRRRRAREPGAAP